MPFFIYTIDKQSNELESFSSPKEISLAGAAGPIAKFVRSKINSSTRPPFEWHMTELELVHSLGFTDEETFYRAVIIDLKPGDKSHAHLYRIRDIWGYTYSDWTPICVRLEELRIDSKVSPNVIKKGFTVSGYLNDPVIEFLYLRGGLDTKGWPWGPVGSVNGVLLWPDALKYFLSAIGGA
ncbi:MAG: hypothetical protein V1799_00625 [bacterium]